jgi:transglutaminase-like putative cysteine protease
MIHRLYRALPVLVACLGLALASDTRFPTMLVVAAVLASVLVPGRITLDRATQRLAMVVAVVLVIAGIRASGMPVRGPHLGAFGYGFAIAPLVLATLRLFTSQPEGGRRVEIALTVVSLLATGAGRPGAAVYVAVLALYLASVVALQRDEEPHRIALAAMSARTRRLAVTLLAVAATAALGFGAFVRAAYPRVERRFQSAFEHAYEEQPGISDSVHLGKMRGLLQSDVVVLRIHGEPPIDRLRGVVLDEYAGGRWTRAREDEANLREVPRAAPDAADVIEVRHVRADQNRIFLPFDARQIATERGSVWEDEMGTLRATSNQPSFSVWFRRGPRDAALVIGPRPADLTVPPRLRGPLHALALEWVRGTKNVEEALAALEAHLRREYTYSLETQPARGVDPVLDFLTGSRRGYCEHFASALALLARTLGIPTRLVLGYRVGERNPLLSHYVVRKKNAHAWVEAFVPGGGWMTVDPTPMTELPQNALHDEDGATASIDALASAWDRTERWLAARSVTELGAAATLGFAIFALQRWWRRRAKSAPVATDGLGFSPPTEGFARLERALARRGLGRALGEPIERWAARLPEPALADVLRRYAAVRYGSKKDPDLDAALEAVLRRS